MRRTAPRRNRGARVGCAFFITPLSLTHRHRPNQLIAMHKTPFYAALCAIAATAAAAPPPLGGPQSQPGALVDAVAAAAAAAPLFVQAFGAPLIGADWSVRSDGLRKLGLEVVG